MIWMRVIPLDQPVTVGPKTGPPGHSEALRGPRGPSVAGRGAHVTAGGKRSGGQTKKIHFWGPFWPPLSPGEGREGPTGVQNTSTHCAWVGRIHIRCLGPLMDLYGTPRAPKRARFGLERPFWGPRRASECPGGPVFGPTVTGWSNGMTRIHIMCLGPF